MRSAGLLGIAAVLWLTAWGWSDRKGTLDYALDASAPSEGTSLIRPASKDEKRSKPNLAARLFVPGSPSLAHLLRISSPTTAEAKLNGYGAVRVAPGEYDLTVRCAAGGWEGMFSVRVSALPGQEHLIECTGSTASRMDVSVFTKTQVQDGPPSH